MDVSNIQQKWKILMQPLPLSQHNFTRRHYKPSVCVCGRQKGFFVDFTCGCDSLAPLRTQSGVGHWCKLLSQAGVTVQSGTRNNLQLLPPPGPF